MIPVSGPSNLDGQVAIITGGARGIGLASALALSRTGAKVVVSDLLSVDDAAETISNNGGQALAIPCDVSDPGQVENLVETTIKAFGRVDILVTSAGICPRYGIDDIGPEEWDKVLDVNLKGTYLCTRAVYPHMRSQHYGKIVCIGSVAGKIGGVIAGPHYAASKGGVHGLVRWLAKNGAPLGIYANGIAPGPVWSDMTLSEPGYHDEMSPLGRLGAPQDIAEAVLFLASQSSNWITGTVLDVNGGMHMT